MRGVVGVRPGGTPLARPRRPADGGRAGRRPPARGPAAPRGTRRAARPLGGLPDPPCAETALVADLRLPAARYPADREVKRLTAELTSHSPRFAELWASGEVGLPQEQSRHKIIDHPGAGLIALDCDALIVAGDDLRITVYTAEPGTQDAERLALAIVLGIQALID